MKVQQVSPGIINKIKSIIARVGYLKSDIGIVEDTDTATHTISSGQYVIWKNELYKASAAIPSGDPLSSTNLTAVSDGIANELNSNLAPLIGNTKWADWTTVTNYTNGESWNGSYYTKVGKILYLRVSVKGLTANTQTELFTLPTNYRPIMAIDFDGFGGAAYLNHAHFVISDTGAVRVYSSDTYAAGFISFPSL